MTFEIGHHEGRAVRCDLDRLVDTRLLVQANSGGGKSWCLRRLLEQTHGKVQHLILDPEGEFASLRERYDYVLAAPRGGDTRAEPRSAALLAERLLELRVSAILDIYEPKHHDRVRFVRLFLDALINAPKRLWHPALIVVDEVHVYCPEKGDAESASAVIDLATRGRKRGFCAVLATQRLAKLNKDAAAEANNKLIGRTGLDVDLKRAADELGFTKERWRELRELDPGQFFAFGPALSRAVVQVTVGGVETTHPKAGARIAFTPPPPTEKVRAMLPKLADLPAEAEERQKTVDELRREVSRLKGELTRAQQAVPAVPPAKVREVPILKDAQLSRLEKVAAKVDATAALFMDAAGKLHAGGAEVRAAIVAARAPASRSPEPPSPGPRPPRPMTDRQPTHAAPSRASPGVSTNGTRDVGVGRGGLSRMLVALAQRPQGLTDGQLGVRAGLALSGTFDRYLSTARANGWVEGPRRHLRITAAGLEALGPYDPLPTGRELGHYWLEKVGGGGIGRMLRAAIEEFPPPRMYSKPELAAAAGLELSGTFDRYLSTLKALELIQGRGELRTSDELFD